MKFLDEYRQKDLVEILITQISKEVQGEYAFMEVCGSHTQAIRRFGLPEMLPECIHLVSGPGCPVCVTDQRAIDTAISIAALDDVILATYGDMIKVPGSEKSLLDCRAEGADIRIIYSAEDLLSIAGEHPGKNIVFFAIGFETTAPSTAFLVRQASLRNIQNLYFYSAQKIMPPAMKAVIDEGVQLNGYICPGHVSTITGSAIYEEFPRKFDVATVISGFEPVDILQSILMLIRQVNDSTYRTEIQYSRAVKPEGNVKAIKLMESVFDLADDPWRGFGMIPKSGLKLRREYEAHDAERQFNISIPHPKIVDGCICGEILKGKKKPVDCGHFGSSCTPVSPLGACMVSDEGTCNAYFKYLKDVG
jgi:hydrogenase expression/formation protein HypD